MKNAFNNIRNKKICLIILILFLTTSFSFSQGSCASPDGNFFGFDGGLSHSYATANANNWCYNNLTAGQTYCWTYFYPATGTFIIQVILNETCGNCPGGGLMLIPACGAGCSSVGFGGGCNGTQYNAGCAIQEVGAIEHGDASCSPAEVCGTYFTWCITIPAGCNTMDVCPMVNCTDDPGNCVGFIPVKLIRLSAINENEDVIIKWSTATEINNDYFTLERSTDGIGWNVVGTIKGAGNSASVLNYEFVDVLPFSAEREMSEELFYRLIQTDFDGTRETFGPISVSKKPQDDILIYPTVSEGSFYVSSSGNSPFAEISVFDILGKKVFEKNISHQWSEESIDLNDMQEGMYSIRVKSGKDFYVKKVIIL